LESRDADVLRKVNTHDAMIGSTVRKNKDTWTTWKVNASQERNTKKNDWALDDRELRSNIKGKEEKIFKSYY